MTHDDKIELIKHSDNQKEIVSIARNDSDWQIRRFAVAYVEDEEILKDILVNDSITSVSIKAMEQINDIDFLIDVCLNNPFSHIRLATLNRIIDERLILDDDLTNLLTKIALNDPDEFLVKAAVENAYFTNPEALMVIADSDFSEEIRKIAVFKITDEEILADFALNDSDVFIRRNAILNPNLKNPDVLSEVLRNDDDEFNRHWACEKITDRNYLLNLIFDESFHHRLDDLSDNSSLDYEDYFEDICMNGDDEYRRSVSVVFIKNQLLLDNIVLNEVNDEIRLNAVKNKSFSNQKILQELLQRENNPDILVHAISKIQDEDILIDYVKQHLNDSKTTLQAISKISDIEFLDELSKNPNPKIRFCAVRFLADNFKKEFNSILRDIAVTDDNKEVCLEATKAVRNPYDLMEIVEGSGDNDIRRLALKNIPSSRLLDNYLSSDNSSDELNCRVKVLALDEEDDELRRIAISKLNDKEVLDYIISFNNDDSKVAEKRLNGLFEDIKRIENERLLNILMSSKDSDVSYIAQKTYDDMINSSKHVEEINRTSDIEKLKSIIENDFNYYVRCEAEGKLEKLLFNVRLDEIKDKINQDRFRDIAEDDTFPLEIRIKALSKIVDERFRKDCSLKLDF